MAKIGRTYKLDDTVIEKLEYIYEAGSGGNRTELLERLIELEYIRVKLLKEQL